LTASGAGAEARKVMGIAAFSGMLIATIIGVCLIPVLFVVIERMVGRTSVHTGIAVPPTLAIEHGGADH